MLEEVDYDEYRLWEIYWAKDLEYPRRSEYYSMGIMAEVRRPNVRNPNSVKIEDMRIKFEEKTTKLDPETRTKMAKASWLGAFGLTLEEVEKKGGSVQLQVERNIMRRKIRPNQT